MLNNYIKVFLRNVWKRKWQSFMNVLGLVLGFTSCLFLANYLLFHLSFDGFHQHGKQIYRVIYDETIAEVQGERLMSTVGPTVGPAFKEAYPAIKDFVRFRYTNDRVLSVGDKRFYENKINYADPSVFSVFTFPLKYGDPATALNDVSSIVISPAVAAKYFGEENPLGKTITIDGNTELKITGVLEPIPANSTLQFDFLMPFEAFKVPFGYPVTLNDWGWISFHNYLLLEDGADPRELEKQFPQLLAKHFPPERLKRFKFWLQPMPDMYFGEVKNALLPSGNKTYLYGLFLTAVLILLIACFNFVNLFTAQSMARAKEIGLRKVAGAGKKGIIFQFLYESVLTTGLSMAFSLLAMELLAGVFSAEFGVPMVLTLSPILLLITFSAAAVVGLIAGLYPALFISAFDSQRILAGNFKTSLPGIALRKGMVVIQFAVSILVISAMLVISSQMKFIQGMNLGFEKDELVILRYTGEDIYQRFPTIRNQLQQHSFVQGVSIGGRRMSGDYGNVPIFTEGLPDGKPMSIDSALPDFFKITGIDVVAGREFSEDFPLDSVQSIILNQAAAKELGWTEASAIGKKIRVDQLREGEVVGVVRNFNFGSLHTEIKPLVITYPRVFLQDIYVRVQKGSRPQDIVEAFRAQWSSVAGAMPFDLTFLNEHIHQQYRTEQQFNSLFGVFSLLAIFIAAIGLYGLVSQEVIYRVKEIGIRKVLGASMAQVISILMNKFLVMVLAANLIAWPLAWYLTNIWLKTFAYHIDVSFLYFAGAGLLTLLIAVSTVLQLCIRAAARNPVDSIRIS